MTYKEKLEKKLKIRGPQLRGKKNKKWNVWFVDPEDGKIRIFTGLTNDARDLMKNNNLFLTKRDALAYQKKAINKLSE